jgi:hypothetical protein
MTLECRIKIKQNRDAHTQYLIIPSSMVQDSQYPFKANEEVEVIVDATKETIVVERLERAKK